MCDALVVDAPGRTDAAVPGDMMVARLRARGASMVVLDGAVRDCQAMSKLTLPVFAPGASPDAFMGELRPWEADTPITPARAGRGIAE